MQPRKNSAAADLPLTWAYTCGNRRSNRACSATSSAIRWWISACAGTRAGGAVRSCPFVDSWSQADYRFLCECLRRTVRTGRAGLCRLCGGPAERLCVGGKRIFWLRRSSIWTFRRCMCRRICAGAAWGGLCSWPPRTGPGGRAPGSCTYPPIPRWKARRFTPQWGVWTRRKPTGSMWKPNPLTDSWNTCCRPDARQKGAGSPREPPRPAAGAFAMGPAGQAGEKRPRPQREKTARRALTSGREGGIL